MASNQIPKGKCGVDGASLAQMSWDGGLRSGAAPQVSETEQPQKAAGLYRQPVQFSIAVAPHPDIPCLPGGQIIPQRASCQSLDTGKCFLQPGVFAFAGIFLLGPRVQIEYPFERVRGNPVLCLVCLTPDLAVCD